MSIPTILIVEDETIVAADLECRLKGLGYEVLGSATTGREAIEMADNLCPRLVLMDISLKGQIDGIDAAEAIRSRRDVPIVYLTAHSDPATLERAKISRPFGYILKPFEERELATQIELALYKHQAEQELKRQREWLSVTLKSIGDAVIATDADGKVEFFNTVAETLTGWMSDEAVGQQILNVLRLVNEDDNSPIEGSTVRMLRGDGMAGMTENMALLTRDGRTVPIEDNAAPILNSLGQVIGTVLVFRDVTEKRRAEKALKEVHEKLEIRVEERTKELKNALTEIKALKERLEKENVYLREESRARHRFGNIIGESDGLKYVLYRAEQVASVNTTVLILGETGTGKELLAAAIHEMSPFKDRPLVTVNCATLPASLVESELFGREKGAFTGADTRQIGRFEIADGSTICLDEIGEMPLDLQAKLLRVIQHGTFERLGSSRTIKVHVRIIATTNRNLEEEVRKGRFRQDLFYRLNVFPISIPPLRQRKEDIKMLASAFTERFAKEMKKRITALSKEAVKMLEEYPWPGNIRELESVIERAVIVSEGPVLKLADKLETQFHEVLPGTAGTLRETERKHILRILSETGWRIEGKGGSAEILGLNASTLRARMRKLGIERPGTRE